MKTCFVLLLAALYSAVQAADDVIVLTDSDFQSKIAEYPTALVEFYAPWCGHCKRLAPEYEKAATILKNADPPVPLVKVDCTVETSTCSKYGVSGYPTLKIFKNGEVSSDYEGPREAAGIVSTMNKAAGPVSKKLETAEEALVFISKDSIGVIGFFKSEDSALAKSFFKVADKLDNIRFAHTTSDDVKKALKQIEEAVRLYRPKQLQSKFEEAEVSSTATGDKLETFLKTESLGLCAERNQGNADQFGKPLVVAYYNVDYTKNPKGTNYWRNRIMKFAKQLLDEGKKKVSFAISNINDLGRELDECGIESRSGDKPYVCAYDSSNKKYKMTEPFSVESFEQFVQDFLDGKVEAHIKSEPIPDSKDGHVTVVVARNFEEVVNNPEKDVLIEFYAPWCGHCKSLAPKYDELAQKLENEQNIVIAKMDATANDVPPQYDVRGFPTIYFVPKNSKDSPKRYEGGREVDDFIKYLAKESTDGISGYDRDGKKLKKDKKDKKKTEL